MNARTWLAVGLLALVLPVYASASSAFTPHVGQYKGLLHGSRTEVEFFLSDHPHLHVADFETKLGHERTHYFSHVQVHNHEFSWTSPDNALHVSGKWTGSRTVSGTLRNHAGVVHHWAAEKVGINGFSRRLAAATFTPKGGEYKAELGEGRKLTFGYIHHPPQTVHLFEIHRTGHLPIHYGGTAYVFDTHFTFTGYSHLTDRYLHVKGHWTSEKVVEGTVKEGSEQERGFRAEYVPPAPGGGPLRPGHGAQSGVLALGVYTGVLHGLGWEVTLHYWDSPHPRIANFETRHGHEYKRYFSDVRVHDEKFSWTSPDNPNLHIAGHFTGTRTIVGTLRNGEGVVHHWEVTHAR